MSENYNNSNGMSRTIIIWILRPQTETFSSANQRRMLRTVLRDPDSR